jgi:hypothetical protein
MFEMTEEVESMDIGAVKVCAQAGTGGSPGMKTSVVGQIWDRTAAEKEDLGCSCRLL